MLATPALMLEGEADYERFDIEDRRDTWVLGLTSVRNILSKAEQANAARRSDAKLRFVQTLEDIFKSRFASDVFPKELRARLETLDAESFEIVPARLQQRRPLADFESLRKTRLPGRSPTTTSSRPRAMRS